MSLLSKIIQTIEADLLKDANYIIGAAGGGWIALASGDAFGGSLMYPAMAVAAAYAVWTERGSALEAYAAGGAIYAYLAKREMDKLKAKI